MALSKISGIYIITCLVNGKYYIGKSVDTRKRLNEHKRELRNNIHSNEHLQNSYNIHSKENFTFELLEEYPNEGFILFSMEHYWATILNVHDRNFGYNIEPTNPYGKSIKRAKESVNKGSQANTGKKRTKEHKAYLSQIRFKRKVIQYSKKGEFIKIWDSATDAEKTISITKGGVNQAIRDDGLAKGFAWRYWEKDYKLKINPPINRKLESLAEQVKKRQIPINQLDMNGNFIKQWESLNKAARALNIFQSSISNCLNGKTKFFKGFKWEKVKI